MAIHERSCVGPGGGRNFYCFKKASSGLEIDPIADSVLPSCVDSASVQGGPARVVLLQTAASNARVSIRSRRDRRFDMQFKADRKYNPGILSSRQEKRQGPNGMQLAGEV